jgi:hypothetical protein
MLRPESLVCSAAPADSATATPPAWAAIRDLPELHEHLFPARATPAPRLGSTPSFATANDDSDPSHGVTDVSQLLRDNTARQIAAEATRAPRQLAKIGAARRRDFLVVVLGGNAAALAYTAFLAGFGVVQVAFLGGFVVILTAGTYWVLYHVMDPY